MECSIQVPVVTFPRRAKEARETSYFVPQNQKGKRNALYSVFFPPYFWFTASPVYNERKYQKTSNVPCIHWILSFKEQDIKIPLHLWCTWEILTTWDAGFQRIENKPPAKRELEWVTGRTVVGLCYSSCFNIFPTHSQQWRKNSQRSGLFLVLIWIILSNTNSLTALKV